jgi:hypothetical protein
MKTEKMSFKNIKDVLSRDEMKMIMAGSGSCSCHCTGSGNVGAWTGIYANGDQVSNAGWSYCTSGYYCRCNWA